MLGGVVESDRRQAMQTEATEHYGRVENGVVVLDKPEELAEGTYVCVTPVKTNSTLGQRLLAGC